MRTLVPFALAILFASQLVAQTPATQNQDRTFYLTHTTSDADITSLITTVRTIVDLQDLSYDKEHKSVVAHAPLDKLTATDWLVQALDRPAVTSPTADATVPEYRIGGEHGEVVRIFRFPSTATNAQMVSMVTAIRTVADIQRLFPFESQKAVIARATVEKVAAAEWIFHQLTPAPGAAVDPDSPAYPLPLSPREQSNEVRILRLNPETSNASLTAIVTAIRTIADLQRLFPYESEKALIMCGAPEKIAVAQWLVHEMRQPAPHASEAHSTHLTPDPASGMDSDVRLFYLSPSKTSSDVTALVTKLRTETGMARLFPFTTPPAVIMRGRPDQVALAESIISKADGAMQ